METTDIENVVTKAIKHACTEFDEVSVVHTTDTSGTVRGKIDKYFYKFNIKFINEVEE